MAVKNINTLNEQADNLLPDNTQQLISPADIRNAIKDLNDSAINRLSDSSLLGLKAYDSLRTYQIGEGTFYNGILYEAIQVTSGSFNEAHWIARSSSSGTWGSITGSITAQTDLQNALNAKQDQVSVNLPLYKTSNLININEANSSQNGYLSSADWISFNAKQDPVEVQSPLIMTGNSLEIQYVSDTQDGILSSQDWIDLNNASVEITYEDALELALTLKELDKGTYYKIVAESRIKRGPGTDGDVIILAVEPDSFAINGYLISRLPVYELIDSSIIGIWNFDISPNIEDKFIYNAKVYTNLTGEVGTAPDSDTVNWEEVPVSNGTFYKTEVDLIHYDIANDWILFRADKRGNQYSFSRSTSDGLYNGIDSFQWGNNLSFGNCITNGVIDSINLQEPVTLTNMNQKMIFDSTALVNRTYSFPDKDGVVALLSDVSASGVTVVTYSALISYMASGLLKPGSFYKIIDFQTIHLIPETSVVNTAEIEPLLCFAISETTISSSVYSEYFPDDLIEYEVGNIFAEDTITPRKGKITYRKDTLNNIETWYDFRNVKFRRWAIDGVGMTQWTPSTVYSQGQNVWFGSFGVFKAVSEHTSSSDFFTDRDNNKWMPVLRNNSTLSKYAWRTAMTEFGGIINANESDFSDVLTFTSGCRNISIPKANVPYNNIVFTNNVNGCIIGSNCSNMTIGGINYAFSSAGTNIGDNCNGIILFYTDATEIRANSGGIIVEISVGTQIGFNSSAIFIRSADNNKIGSYVTYTSISYAASGSFYVYANEIGDYSGWNVLTSTAANRIGYRASNNYIKDGTGSKIGIYSSNNIIMSGSYMQGSNSIGDFSSNNIIKTTSGTCLNNVIGNSSNNNSIKDNASNNTIGNESNNNTIDSLANNCKIGNKSNSNSITLSSSECEIGNGSNSNTLTSCSWIFIGNNSMSNSFIGAINNKIGNNSSSNLFDNSHNMVLGNWCSGNQFNANCLFNYLGHFSSNNIFTSSHNNELANNCSSNTFTAISMFNKVGSFSSSNTFNSASGNTLGTSNNSNIFNTNCSNNRLGDFCTGNEFYHNANQNTLQDSCYTNIIGLNDYSSSASNLLMRGCNNITLIGSNNVFEQNCSFITSQNHMGYYQCYFAATSKNINQVLGATYDGGMSMGVTRMRLIIPYNKTEILNINELTGTVVSNKTFDMKDENDDLWASTVNSSGIITTVKLS